MGQGKNVFEELLLVNHDEDFYPSTISQPTTAPPGSSEKIEVLAKRVERGEDLWHRDDVVIDFSEAFSTNQFILSRDEPVKMNRHLFGRSHQGD
jgi:hypothetical protein